MLYSDKIGGGLSLKWAQKWPRKGFTLLFNYFMRYKHIFSILLYFWGVLITKLVVSLFLNFKNLQEQHIFRFVPNFVFQIGQENYVRPGNSDFIILRIPVKTHEIFNKRRFGLPCPQYVNYLITLCFVFCFEQIDECIQLFSKKRRPWCVSRRDASQPPILSANRPSTKFKTLFDLQ